MDVDSIDGELVVLADLSVEVEANDIVSLSSLLKEKESRYYILFLGLHWSTTWPVNDLDTIEPLYATSTNIPHDQSTNWVAVDLW